MQATLATPVSPLQQTRRYPIYVRRFAAVLFIIFAGWLIYPALFAAHVEAFSARLQSMAIMDLRGQPARDDMAYPVDLEYFHATRGGTIHVLEWIMRLTHTTGEINFRLLIWMSFVLFVTTSIIFVRRWSDEPIWTALAVLILTPGLVEISFYYADNLPSAAMVTLALALISKRTKSWTWFLSGVALACGTLLRIDAIVAAPFLGLMALLQDDRRLSRLLLNWILISVGAGAMFLLYWHTTEISLWQSLLIGKLHGSIHNSWGDRIAPWRVVVLFFGPTTLLIALGMVKKWSRTSRAWNLAMIVWPLLSYIIFITRTVELRDYLLLGAPFILLHGSVGLTRVLHLLDAGSRRERLLVQASIALYILTLFSPPLLVLHDGPRFALGRIYSPPMWRRWQRITDDSLSQLHSLATTTQPGKPLMILTTLFQSDRYLHLALLEDGFSLQPLPGNPSCGGVETYQKGDITIHHVRTESPYLLLSAPPLSMPKEYVRAYQINSGFSCLAPADYDHALMITWGRMWQGYIAETPEFARPAGPLEIPFPEQKTPNIGQHKYLQVQRIIPLSREDIANLTTGAQLVLQSYERGNQGDWLPPHGYEQFHKQAEPLVWKTLPHQWNSPRP